MAELLLLKVGFLGLSLLASVLSFVMRDSWPWIMLAVGALTSYLVVCLGAG